MVMIILIIVSILAVQIVHPTNRRVAALGHYSGCERCPDAFSSVWMSLCTFTQQLLAGDSWGAVSLPIIGMEAWTFVFFVSVLVTVSIAVMNLILAVIVDSGQKARESAMFKKMKDEELAYAMQCEHFYRLCEQLDE